MNQAQAEIREDKFPSQIKYIVGNEACERYSFYGMRSILVIFMVQYLAFENSNAVSVFHLFVSLAYFTPLLGAYLADRVWGKYKTIMRLSIIYCLGHLVLALGEGTTTGLYLGLGLIALGAGGIKPCVSANVGDQFTKKNQHMIKKVFDLFYWLINFGSFTSTMITPLVLAYYGPAWAFGIPGILMAIATFIFWIGRKQYVYIPPSGKNPHGTLAVIMSAFKNKQSGTGFLDGALKDHPAEAVNGVRAAFAVGKIFIPVTFFWTLFDQHSSTWVLQANQMDLNVFGFKLKASQIASLNPVMVMVLIPLFAFGIYPLIEKVLGITMTPLKKMGTGMVIAGFSFLQVAIIQHLLDSGVQLSVGWQIFPYLTITASEIMISITGLEFSYTQAPRFMRSTLMSIWFLTIFFGNMFTGIIAEINVFKGSTFFIFFGLITIAFSMVFIWIAKTYKMQNFVEEGRS